MSRALAVLVLGTGWSALVNVLNVTSPPAFVPPDELPQRMAYAMNMGDFIFGIGTFVTPLIIIYCARRFGLIRTLYGFAAVSVIIWLLYRIGYSWIKRSGLGKFDRRLGAAAGIISGLLLCVLITVISMVVSGPTGRAQIQDSKSGAWISSLLIRFRSDLPEYVQERADGLID